MGYHGEIAYQLIEVPPKYVIITSSGWRAGGCWPVLGKYTKKKSEN
jgi:hypothetical protein